MSSPVAANEAVGGDEVARTTPAFQPDTTTDFGVERSGTGRPTERTLRGRVADWPLTAIVSVIWALHRLWLALPPRASVATSPPRDDRRWDERRDANARTASAPSRTAGRRTAAVDAEACALSESHES